MDRLRPSQSQAHGPIPATMRTAVASFAGLRCGNRASSVLLLVAPGPRRRPAAAPPLRASSASSVPVFLASEPALPVSIISNSSSSSRTATSTLMFVGEHLRVAEGFGSLRAKREYFLSLGLDYDRSCKYFLVVEGLERRLRSGEAPAQAPHALDAVVGMWEVVSSFFEKLVAFSRFAVFAAAFCVSVALDHDHDHDHRHF